MITSGMFFIQLCVYVCVCTERVIYTDKVVVVGVKEVLTRIFPQMYTRETRDNVSKQYVCKKWFVALKR